MSSTPRDDLRARMAQLLDQELVERAGARVASSAQTVKVEAEAETPPPEPDIAERLSREVWQIAAGALRMPEDQLDPQENLANLGVDSIGITEIMVQISRHFGISVAPTTFFEARDLDDLSSILMERYGSSIAQHYAKQAFEASPPQKAEREDEAGEAQKESEGSAEDPDWQETWLRRHRAASSRPAGKHAPARRTARKEVPPEAAPIAILSMEGMFPQSPDLETFETHLAAGDDCIEEIPPERWDWQSVYGDPKKGAFTDVKYGGFVPEADHFDAGFFNISPREAELMDPQHRLFMECVWSLIEKGGYAPGSLSGKKIGLFLGINLLDYTDMVNRAGIMEAQQLTGLGHAFCPNRLSFLLDIHGPSEVIDTACSSSLVAIHRAVMCIRHEGCEMAIAGGSNLMLSPTQHIMFSKVGMITPDGRCKTFSKDANGYARADGVGAVLLKRLDLAERDGDPILGVIRGSVEHHGGGATSLTAPNPKAQGRLIAEAHRQAGVDPRTIGLIECHGTGTPLGDPIEIEGLKLAFQELYRDWNLEAPAKPHIGLGSVKSNIGHAETAAGVAGLIKVVLSMKARTRFRSLHCDEPNPLLDLSGSAFYLQQNAGPWLPPVVDGSEEPLRAGLSSFGAGGANVHLVIEDYRSPERHRLAEQEGPWVVPVSAKSESALLQSVSRLSAVAPDADLTDLAYTLQIGRDAMRYRVAFVASEPDNLVRQMKAFLAGDEGIAVTGKVPAGRKEKSAPLDPMGKSSRALVQHWVAGGDVDWLKLYGNNRPRRIALPAYPFQRKRYWLPEVETGVSKARGTLTPSSAGHGKYLLTLTGHEVFLADHRVAGVPVLPGVAYLELARAAASREGIAHPGIRQVVWTAPLQVEQPVEVTCETSRLEDGSLRASVFSQSEGGDRLLHAQLKIVPDDIPDSRSVELETLRKTPAQNVGKSEVYAAFDAMGLVYGPGHRVISELAIISGTEVLGLLELPDSLTPTLGDFGLHPSLLDGALQSALGLVLRQQTNAPETAALPFSIDTVEISGPCEARMFAHVRSGEAAGSGLRKMAIDLIAADGSVRVSMRGFTTRVFDTGSAGEAASPAGQTDILCFEPVWQPVKAEGTADRQTRRIVLLSSGAGQADALQAVLPDWKVHTLDDNGSAPLNQRYDQLARQLLEIAQAELSSGPVLIQLLLHVDRISAPLAGLSALYRSIAREHPKLIGQVLSVSEGTDAERVSHLLQKATAAPAGALLKADGNELSMEVWKQITSRPGPGSIPWRNGGVYLITGGTGGLGKLLAGEVLDQAPDASVILASRNAPDIATSAWMSVNPRLHFIQADCSDEGSVQKLIATIRKEHGKLDGVIHAAGVIQDEALARKTPDQLSAVLAPKVTGAVALDSVIGSDPLDFLILFSSISGVVGNAGQADYAAANSFLDAFAEAREARRRNGECHGRTISIAWPLWRDGGMSLETAQEDLMRRTTGLAPIGTRAALNTLNSLLQGSAARVLIAAGDTPRIRRFVSDAFGGPAPATSAGVEPVGTQARKSPSTFANLRRLVLTSLTEIASDQLKVSADDLDPDEELTEYGFDSIGFTQFANRLNDRFALELTPTLFFEYPTLDGLAGYLSEAERAAISKALGTLVQDAEEEEVAEAKEPSDVPAKSFDAPSIAGPLPQAGVGGYQDERIAVVGMSCQFPGAPDIDAFWDVLSEGRSCISEVPAERWDWRSFWGDPSREPGKTNVKWGGFIEGMAAFDAAFFGVSPPEARMMDPQQRLLLTEAWRVMEDAGYAPSALAGSKTGVFIGTADTGYSRLIAESGVKVEGYSMTGLAPSLGPNRISYFYDLNGPSVAVETACSSALIAIHRAVEAIRSGSCTAAIAGGINALLLPEAFVGFSKAGMLSPEGLCKPFSSRADGYARGEGIGLVFLKKLSEAERDGDRILGVIRASAENHGGHAASLTAPNPKAQADLLRTAYGQAGIDPRTIGYIEAHGTGTPLGDPIEVEALTAAFADLTRDAETTFGPVSAQRCAIGSVKSNIGHQELAAGIAGFIKVLLQMRHGVIVRSLHSEDLNPYLKLAGSPFHVAQGQEAWRPVVDGDGNPLPRRAGVSSFGFGGTNAHVVIEEYPTTAHIEISGPNREPELIVLSAKSEGQLNDLVERFLVFLQEPDQSADLADIAYTLQIARDPMEFRLGFLASTRAEMTERLKAYLMNDGDGRLHVGRVRTNRKVNSVLESDGPLREAAAGLAERGRQEDLLALWAGGLGVDWRSVLGERRGRRVKLPGYPFAETHYWIGGGGSAPVPVTGSAGDRSHFTRRLEGAESYLRDHIVNGEHVLPGVMSFELLRQALQSGPVSCEAFELIGHTWTDAVVVGAGGAQVEVVIGDLERGDAHYTISANVGAAPIRHAEGVIRLAAPGHDVTVDLAVARSSATDEVEISALYEHFESLGLVYGSDQRAITGLWKGHGGAVARLELPEAAEPGLSLHPAILDGALQGLLCLNEKASGLALPFAVRRVLVRSATSASMWAVIRTGECGAAIDICDDRGNLAVRFEDFISRAVASEHHTTAPAQGNTVRLGKADRLERALKLVAGVAAGILEVAPESLDVDTELGDFGFDSVSMTAFASHMNAELGLALTPADFFEYATLERLAEHVVGDLTDEQLGVQTGSLQPEAPSRVSGSGPSRAAASKPAIRRVTGEDPIAIVGHSCCFPMAADADAFWSNLIDGRDCISRIPEDRWSWRELDGDPRQEPTKTNIHWGGFIDGVYEFDPLFFGISPREARLMDPQQRLMLTHAWKVIEDAGHAPDSLAGEKVGVFVGTSASGYREMIGADSGGEGYVATGSVASVGPNRISYFLDLHGPSEPVETACSSSLVALHRAVQAIRAGDCDMALVGGVNTILTPEAHINFAKAGMLSADGRCKTFSARADGYVRGEGVGMLFIRKLSDAERDGDPILGVVRGTAINHGGHANSLTAPNTQAQADLLRTAYANAGVDPRTVGYIEAHGTGTALGDPVEINALKSAFRASQDGDVNVQSGRCHLGSVKTNIGHLELAAGVAGVIKVLKQIQHRKLAPSLHCDDLNPYIDLAGTPFKIVRSARDWTPLPDEGGNPQPLRAGISSFGFGGVNAHAIVEEYAGSRTAERGFGTTALDPGKAFVFPLSARDHKRLKDAAGNLLAALETDRFTDRDLGDLAYTLQVGRSEFSERLALVSNTLEQLCRQLRCFVAGGNTQGLFTGRARGGESSNASAAANAAPAEIARNWVAGAKIDWQEARQTLPEKRRRLRLPTYPFAREVYRVRSEKSPPPVTLPSNQQMARETAGAVQLSADAFYFRDHVVQGTCILPGAMSLDLACRAVMQEHSEGSLPIVLTDFVWRRPVTIQSGRSGLQTEFTPGTGQERTFRIVAADGGGVEFVRGKATALASGMPSEPLDIPALQRACRTAHDPDWLYACYASLGIEYGPSFRAITDLKSEGSEVLARLRLPSAVPEEPFSLHPSLLDGAFQAALVAFPDDGEPKLALPFGIDRVEVLRATTSVMWAHLQVRSTTETEHKLDIVLADDDGHICARLEGFTLRILPGRGPGLSADMPTSGGSADEAAVERYFVNLIASETEIDANAISVEAPLEAYGIDSVLIMQLTDRLERDFGPLSKTLFFDHQTLAALIDYFRKEHAGRLADVAGGTCRDKVPAKPLAVRDVAKSGPVAVDEPIAIIGLAGRYPGGRTVEEFWQNLASGRDSVTDIPANRWDHSRFYDPVRSPGKTTGKWGGFVDGHDRFDPMFFNIAPREAELMDPQERLFLQTAWETLEDAGYTRASLSRDGDVGVFVGVMWEEYQLYGADLSAGGTPVALSGSAASIANRVSYFLDLHGPSIALDTMCSSSLTAIHLACDSLRAGSCAAALAGGVNLTVHPNKYLALSQGRFLSSKGRCESFGEGGDGYVPSEGVGAVLLKSLSRAEADGDRIYGVILGSALNHGGKTNGYTVPNPAAQTAVIETALRRSGVSGSDISYVEAHGTGTSLGDPIEIAALTRAFGSSRDRLEPCAIGSVKSNIGHAESAAGMAGLTKLLLQLKHGKLAPSIHSERLNPNIDFGGSPFRVQRSFEDWPVRKSGDEDTPRLAGLSSFGAGGSNAHLVIGEYLSTGGVPMASGPAVYPFSARDPERLRLMLQRFRSWLDSLKPEDMCSVAYTLQEGREAFEERLAIVADGKEDLTSKVELFLSGSKDNPDIFRERAPLASASENPAASLRDAAAFWVKGGRIDWTPFRQSAKVTPISLPTYPFAEDLCWLPAVEAGRDRSRSELLPLLFKPVWTETPPVAAAMPSNDECLHVLCGPKADTEWLAARLRSLGSKVDVLEYQGSGADQAFTSYAVQLLDLLKGMSRNRRATRLQLVICCDGDNVLLEGLAGQLRCAALEAPTLTCQVVTLDAVTEQTASALRSDAAGMPDAAQLRYDGSRRLFKTWGEVPHDGGVGGAVWRAEGVYLLTGGAGGIGLHVARDIASSGVNPHLWLTGRSALTPELQTRLDDLRGLGATVDYRQVDGTDPEAVAALLEEIDQKTDSRLAGVFHGAGLTRDGLLATKTEETFRQVLAPKVTGVCVLDEALGDRPLDFVALFASAAGALGNPGQSDYATANAFLDSFAEWRNEQVLNGRRHGRTFAIDWPYWRDGGMTMDQRTIAAMETTAGVRPLATRAALAALRTILRSRTLEQVLVLEGDHDRLRARITPPVSPKQMAPARAERIDAAVKRSSPVEAISTSREETLAAIKSAFSAVLGIAEGRLGLEDTVDRFGVDSVSALDILDRLEDRFGPLPQSLLFEFPTINRLADDLVDRLAGSTEGGKDARESESQEPRPDDTATRPDSTEAQDRDIGDIAIIAVAGRYPGADTIEEFATVLREGRDCVTEVPPERSSLVASYSSRKGKPQASHCKWGGFLSDVDCFDAGFFGYSARAADLADPQERLFLGTAWHLFERAGHTRSYLADHYDRRVGVFVGAMYNQYPALAVDPDERAALALSSYSAIANRTSFFFDLQGPSVAIDSMCSSGLQAVHQACQSLKAGECKLAVAGGVNLSLHPAKYQTLSQAGLATSDPQVRAFAGGDGYLPAEGVGAVLLKPLSDALRDGDRVLAVIKGSIANHAGHSAGYAVPNVDAQGRLLSDAFRRSGIDPASISYVEAAATGAQIGDAVELRALSSVFNGPAGSGPAIGSVKTNMGHAEAASGLAQLTKVLLQFEYGELFPSFVTGSAPDLLSGTCFRPQTQLSSWARAEDNGAVIPRRAAVSSFGAGGSNVHVILEEAPDAMSSVPQSPETRALLFPVSARTEEQLAELRRLLACFLRANDKISLQALSNTLRFGRERFAHQLTFVAATLSELIRQLQDRDFRENDDAIAEVTSRSSSGRGPMLVLPGYPFKKERHWLTATVGQPGSGPGTADGEEIVLPETVARTPEDASARVKPGSNEPLEFVSRILSKELRCAESDLDQDADFERLGADSMVQMRLIYEIEEAFGLSLSRSQLACHRTPGDLAELVEKTREKGLPASIDTRDHRQSMPGSSSLSENQKGLWILQALDTDNSSYNVPIAFRCQNLDRGTLEKAVRWLELRYPVLSSCVGLRDEAPVMVPRSETLTVRTPRLPDGTAAQTLLRQRSSLPFDLGKEVFRVEWISGGELAPNESLVLIVAHHIIIDGVSSEVIAHDFWEAYEKFADGQPDDTPPRREEARYPDFVSWEESFLLSANGAAQRAYWLEKLQAPLPSLRLPADPVTARAKENAGDWRSLDLGQEICAALEKKAKRLNIGLASLYLSLFAILLHRYTGERDLVIGVPTMRRPERRFAETVGYCANIIALRLDLDPAIPSGELSQRVHSELMDGLARGDYPFAAIARELGGTATGRPPYQVAFAFQNFGSGSSAWPGSGNSLVEFMPEIRQPNETLLGMEVQNGKDGVRVLVSGDGVAVSPASADRILQHYRRLLEAFVADDADKALAPDLPMLTPAEEDRALHSWNHVKGPAPSGKPVHEMILGQAGKTPKARAVCQGAETLSYKALVSESMRIGTGLEKQGIGRGDRVAVLLGREPAGIAALLAVLSVGAVWVPLDPDCPDERLSYILADAGVRTVLSRGKALERLRGAPGIAAQVVDLDRIRPPRFGLFSRRMTVQVAPDDPAYIIYTSGSTGAPKGVVVSHGALSDHCEVMVREYGLTSADGVLQFAPSSVDTALEQMLPVLTAGGRLELRPDELQSPSEFAAFLREREITVADLPPVYLHELLRTWDQAGTDLSGLPLRTVIVGGEALTPQVVERWGQSDLADRRLINAYGPTEATITALVHTVRAERRDITVPIGRPLPGVEVFILDEHGNPVPDGVIGELHLGGRRLAIGYHERPKLTNQKFRERRIGQRAVRTYATGDLASFRPNSGGLVEFHGRIDDQVKVRGHRIELGEVEAAIMACGIAEVAVVLENASADDLRLSAYLGVKEKSFNELDVRRRVASMLPAHMVPSRWVCLDRLPKTASGKIDRIALRQREKNTRDNRSDGANPGNWIEAALLAIWQELLQKHPGDRPLGLEDDFGDAGGHSLLAIRLLSRIEQAFGCSLSFADLIDAPTISAQAGLLAARGVIEQGETAEKTNASPLLCVLGQPPANQRFGDIPKVFLIHPIGGTLGCYQPLVQRLSGGCEVYGIRAEGIEPGETAASISLKAMADHYRVLIKTAQPEGPYHLLGWSFGGVVAFEIARQMEREGDQVSLCGLIDSYTPAQLKRFESETVADDEGADEKATGSLGLETAFVRDLFGADVPIDPSGDWINELCGLTEIRSALPGAKPDDIRRLFAVFQSHYQLLKEYELGESNVPLTLVRASGAGGEDHSAAWAHVSGKSFSLHRVETDHFGILGDAALSEWIGVVQAPIFKGKTGNDLQ